MADRLYYVTSIEYNKVAGATNRTVPREYHNRNDAEKEFHRRMYENNGNPSLGWFNVMTWDQYGNPDPELCGYWEEAIPEPQPEPETPADDIPTDSPPEEVV